MKFHLENFRRDDAPSLGIGGHRCLPLATPLPRIGFFLLLVRRKMPTPLKKGVGRRLSVDERMDPRKMEKESDLRTMHGSRFSCPRDKLTWKCLLLIALFLLAVIGFLSCYHTLSNYDPVKKGVTYENVIQNYNSSFLCHWTLKEERNKNVYMEAREWWQMNEHSRWHVYSAYLDWRPNVPLIRIVAMVKERTYQTLYCQMQTDTGKFTIVPAQEEKLWIHSWDSAKPGIYYEPFLLSCAVPQAFGHPLAISISEGNPCEPPVHWLKIPIVQRQYQDGFVVCLKPLNFTSDVSLRLVEWLELQFLLGADTIFAYITQVNLRTWRVLHYYAKLGKLHMKNYTALGSENFGLWQKRRHEMAIYNDCLYRHLASHKFVINLDLDEAIIPVVHNSWQELMADRPLSASLSARCTYFFDSLGEDPSIPQYMHMLRHVYRSSAFAAAGFAQKSFFSTLHAEAVSNHFALRAVKPNVQLLSGLGLQEARLHHYRKECPSSMERECDENYMRFRQKDTLIWKYKDRLVKKVIQRKQELKI